MPKKKFEPMKAATLEAGLDSLRYPALFSPKLDGYRAAVVDGVLVSSSMTPIPNKELQARYGRPEFEGLDGELVTGLPWAPGAFNASSTVVRARDADASTTGFYVFDMWNLSDGFADRYAQVTARCSLYGSTVLSLQTQLWPVEHRVAHSAAEANDLEALWVGRGYEGMMGRAPNGPYKFGRSTMVEQWLYKVKRFSDAECVIEAVIEEQQNTNTNEGDNFGRTKRSTKKSGMVAKGTLGGFSVRGLNGRFKDVPFNCSTGCLTEAQCAALWAIRGSLPGRSFTYKFFPYGSKDRPRFPGFLKAEWLVDLVELGQPG